TSGAVISGLVSVSGTDSDPVRLASVDVSIDGGSPVVPQGRDFWSYALDTTHLTNGSHTITARATNTFAQVTVAKVIVSVSNSPSSQPPTISITQPANGATVSGTASVQGTAGDATGLATVTVSLDGGASGVATGLQNWNYAVDTTKLSNGAHTVTAAATNQAGLTATATIILTVSNGTSSLPPTISITQPANGATVSGTASVQGTAGDATGLVTVPGSLDGGASGVATGLQNWNYAVDTTKLSNGAHTVTATATNQAGLTAT